MSSKFEYDYSDIWFTPDINFVDGDCLKEELDANNLFSHIFSGEINSSLCIFTDGSKMLNVPFSGFTLCTVGDSVVHQFRAPHFISSFYVELMAILTTISLTLNNE